MKFLKLILFAGCALALVAGTASAGINSKEEGSVLIYPEYFATNQAEPGGDGTTRHTYLTVTNTLATDFNAHIEVVGGTACDDCNFDLYLTGMQTKRLWLRRELVGGTNWSTVILDASSHSQFGTPLVLAACPEAKGFVVVILEDVLNGAPVEPRTTIGARALQGDEVVVNVIDGSATQVGAIAVQSAIEVSPDRDLNFDGEEFERFPDVVSANFWAPNAQVDPRLVLFNVDFNTHRVGGDDPPTTYCSLNYANANEVRWSRNFTFGCWTDTRLFSMGPGFHEDILGTANGFLWVQCSDGTHGAIQTAVAGNSGVYPYAPLSQFKDTLFQSRTESGNAELRLTPDITGGNQP
jgi:hypothetical protein